MSVQSCTQAVCTEVTVQNRKNYVLCTADRLYMPDELAEKSKRINVRIPIELYSQVVQSYGITEAVVQGLERLINGADPQIQENSNDELVISLKDRIESLENQLKVKDSQLESIDSLMGDRIRNLEEQLRAKDSQLEKQAYSLQSVIQENSRLNLKLLPEAQETKNTQEQKITRWQHLKIFVFGSK